MGVRGTPQKFDQGSVVDPGLTNGSGEGGARGAVGARIEDGVSLPQKF